MNIWSLFLKVLAITFLIISGVLVITEGSWSWTGPLALAYLFMDYSEENK